METTSPTLYRGEFANRLLAVSVAPHEAIQRLEPEADDLVCLLSPPDFHSVGFYYADFDQTTDDEVIELLQSL